VVLRLEHEQLKHLIEKFSAAVAVFDTSEASTIHAPKGRVEQPPSLLRLPPEKIAVPTVGPLDAGAETTGPPPTGDRACRKLWIPLVMSFLILESAVFAGPSGWPLSPSPPAAAEQDAAHQTNQTNDEKNKAAPAYLLPQRATAAINRRTKGWLSVSGEFRTRFEARTDEQFRSGRDDSFFLTRVRLDVDVHPTRWVRFFLEGQDAQAMGMKADPDPPQVEDTFDLRQAYVEWFDRERQGFGVRVGRQEFRFGDERLVGALNWGNTSRSFDAVRLFYAKPKYRVDLFASSVVVIEDGAFNKHRDGENLHGVYGSFQNVIPQATIEGYLLWRTLPRVVDERGSAGDADVYTFGCRWAGTLPGSFDYRLELAGQRGTYASDHVRAGALHTQFGYTVRQAKTSPRLLVEYNFASGDREPRDGTRGTFDQLFPTNHDKYGIADLVGWRNMHNLRTGVGLKLTERVGMQVDYHSFWLASRRDALYSAGGIPIARIPSGASSRHVGQELDFDVRITLTKDLSLWAGYAHLLTGGFLKQATAGASTGFYYTMLTYRF